MPELWSRKIFPKTDLPGKRLRVVQIQQYLDELDDDGTDIYKSNVIDHLHNIRPNNTPSVNNMCLAEFSAYYYKG